LVVLNAMEAIEDDHAFVKLQLVGLELSVVAFAS
jgi:hypothetical protein